MRALVLVGMGGCIGAIARYLVSGWVQQLTCHPWLPFGTLTVNSVGCFVIGLAGGVSENLNLLTPSTRLFALIGILGSFTTFSTFSYETLMLLRDGQSAAALANVGLHIVLGLGAAWAGFVLASLA